MLAAESVAVFQQGQDELQVLTPPCQLSGGGDDMDSIFGPGFGSQKSNQPLPLEAQLKCILMNDRLVDHLGDDPKSFITVFETIR